MKKLVIAGMALMSFFILASCSKSSSDGGGSSSGSFTYKVDGATVTADSAWATLYTLGVSPYNRMIDIFVFKGGNQTLEMHCLPKTGAQTVGPSFTTAWLTYITYSGSVPSEIYECTSGGGSFNLSVCDTVGKKLVGTFNFTGTAMMSSGTKSVSEGNINITKMIIQ